MDQRPIAVFDSGLGGLTVVRSLRERLPAEDIVYFGDTARVPYGTKTPDTVMRFSREISAFLMRMNPKCIVAACNTASAVCLPRLGEDVPVPMVGVVTPGAASAVETTRPGDLVAVIGTEATIASNAYRNAIHAIDSTRSVVQVACPLFVPIVEEGVYASDPIVRMAVDRYLAPLRRLKPTAVLLGCTHYPMIRTAIAEYLGASVALIDSGDATADEVGDTLRRSGALSDLASAGSLHCYVSDHPRRFQTVGSHFLGSSIPDVVRVCSEELARGADALSSRPRASA